MNDILAFITKTFIFGHQGHVVVMGDFNFSPNELEHFEMWRNAGWDSAQQFAANQWHQEWAPTCKGSTERDLIWMSPSVLSLCTRVQISQVFSEHSSVSVTLRLPETPAEIRSRPLPSEIPWSTIDKEGWHQHCATLTFDSPDSSDQFYAEFGSHFESSMNGFVQVQGSRLHSSHCGRATRMSPSKRTLTQPTPKASRQSELTLQHDLVGTAVLLWFRQARRIQSYLHAIRAGKTSPEALQYRHELWQSIRKAKGFETSFAIWWGREGFDELIGALPIRPPELEQAEWIYAAFQASFRRFETWHLAKKQNLMQLKYDKTYKAIHGDLREARPEQIDSLWEADSYVVLAVRPGSRAVLVDQPVKLLAEGQWFHNGCQIAVKDTLEEMIVFDRWPELQVGDSLLHQVHTTSDDQVHEKLIELWKPRWNKLQAVESSIWERASSFVQTFMPRLDLDLPDISSTDWYRAVARLKPRAARGPDGFARLDLLHMSLFHVQILLGFLHEIEQGVRAWPAQILQGIVITLAKHANAHQADGYRPIVLFSMVYRVWASLRCRQLLRQVEQFVHSDAHGFLPHREPMQSWLTIQSTLELALQSNVCLAGIATDLKKAFNNIQRPQWFCLATAVGVPDRLLVPWKNFLTGFTRRFQVHQHLSEPVGSNVGFAEGDPLSVFAMTLLDWTLHTYQTAMSPSIRTLTFVDNISMMSTDVPALVLSFFALRAFLELWGLEADITKSYAWCTTALERRILSQLGIQIVTDAAELGGSLTLGAARRVRLFLNRGAKLAGRWQRLQFSRAPLIQKLACLPLTFWSSALHGCLGTVFSEKHIHDLRKLAVKHLRIRCGPFVAIDFVHHFHCRPWFLSTEDQCV